MRQSRSEKSDKAERKVDKQSLVRARAQQYAASKLVADTVTAHAPTPTAQASAQAKTPMFPSSSSKNGPPSPPQRESSRSHHATEAMLQKLTQKLTSHIREELLRENLDESLANKDVCDTIVSRIDHFVQAELSSFSCPICFEVMGPPTRSPILLFPCGHTFCDVCITTHLAQKRSTSHSNKSGTCPFCRALIDSRAVNQSLKELIDQFVAQKTKIEQGRSRLDDAFVSQRGDHTSPYSSRNAAAASAGATATATGSTTGGTAGYQSQLRSCEMRQSILSHQMQDLQSEVDGLSRRREKMQAACAHLQDERRKLDAKMQLIREEMELVDHHLGLQGGKIRETQEAEAEVRGQVQLLAETLAALAAEADKLRLLAHGVRADH